MSITDPLPEVLRTRPFAEPLYGTVTAVAPPANQAATGTATIVLYGQANTVACLASYTPAVGDVALVLVADRRLIAIGRMSTAPSHPVIPAPPPPPSTGTLTVPAVAAGTYQAGRLRTDRTDVLQGPDATGPNQGAWVYGTTIAGTLAGLTAGAGRVWVNRTSTADTTPQAVRLYLHNATTLPAGPPALMATSTTAAIPVGLPGWVALPAAWVAQLAAGTAYGVGIGDSSPTPALPFVSLASLARDGQSGTIQIDWS